MAQQHEENMEKIRNTSKDSGISDQAVTWMKTQLGVVGPTEEHETTSRARQEDAQKKFLLEQLQKQQEDIQKQIVSLTMDEPISTDTNGPIS